VSIFAEVFASTSGIAGVQDAIKNKIVSLVVN